MMKFRVLFSVLLACFCFSSVQAQEDILEYNLDSPHGAIVTHLGFLDKGNYHPEIAAKTFAQKNRTQKEAIDLAIKLKTLFEEEGINIDLTQVPQDTHYIDPQAKYHKYQLTKILPEVYLVRVNQQWIYSEETARSIALLTQETNPVILKKVRSSLPQSFNKLFLGLYLWQYVALILLSVLLAGLYGILVFLSSKVLLYRLKRWIPHHIVPTEKPISIGLVTLVLMLVLPMVQLPLTVEKTIIVLLEGILTLVATIVCYRSVNLLTTYIRKRNAQRTGKLDMQVMLLVKPLLRVIVIIVGTLLTLRNLNFDISTLLAGVSIGGIGLALASQDTLKNLFGSFMIFIDKPFSVGDTIAIDAIEGKVEEIGLRSTRIRTDHESVTYVPNGKLADTHIDNYGLKRYRHFDTHVAVAYHTPPVLTEAFIEGLRKIVAYRPYIKQEKNFIYLEDIQDSMLKFLFCIRFHVNSRKKELQCRQEVMHDIIDLAELLGIRIALSTQKLHMESFPKQDASTTDSQELRQKLQGFLEGK